MTPPCETPEGRVTRSPRTVAIAPLLTPLTSVPPLPTTLLAGTGLPIRLDANLPPTLDEFLWGIMLSICFFSPAAALLWMAFYNGWSGSADSALLIFFSVPSCIISLVLGSLTIRSAGKLFLSWCAGAVWIEVDKYPLQIGARFTWRVQQIGRLALRSAQVRLLSEESSMYYHGTSYSTDTHIAQNLPLPSQTKTRLPQGVFAVPTEVMHSFASSFNHIRWHLELTGRLWGWSFTRTFSVIVLPADITLPPSERYCHEWNR
jgi:hypothetical protein